MEVKKALTDRCRECGCSIYRHQGCPSAFLCDDHCRMAGHDHSKRKPSPDPHGVVVPFTKPVKESSMEPDSPVFFGQTEIGGPLMMRLKADSPLVPAPQSMLDDLQHESLRSAMLAGGLSEEATLRFLEADTERTRIATERTLLETARLELAMPAKGVTTSIASATDVALQKAGIVPRVCKQCGGGYESSTERPCNSCLAKLGPAVAGAMKAARR